MHTINRHLTEIACHEYISFLCSGYTHTIGIKYMYAYLHICACVSVNFIVYQTIPIWNGDGYLLFCPKY